jgi:hypothetical protein
MEFIGAVQSGRLDPHVGGQVRDYLRTFDGRTVSIKVKAYKSKRSSAQNRRYFALLAVGAEDLWGDRSLAEQLHEDIAHLLLALPTDPVTGAPRRMRTPSLNTEEFGRYMDMVERKLVELGADLTGWDDEVERMSV